MKFLKKSKICVIDVSDCEAFFFDTEKEAINTAKEWGDLGTKNEYNNIIMFKIPEDFKIIKIKLKTAVEVSVEEK